MNILLTTKNAEIKEGGEVVYNPSYGILEFVGKKEDLLKLFVNYDMVHVKADTEVFMVELEDIQPKYKLIPRPDENDFVRMGSGMLEHSRSRENVENWIKRKIAKGNENFNSMLERAYLVNEEKPIAFLHDVVMNDAWLKLFSLLTYAVTTKEVILFEPLNFLRYSHYLRCATCHKFVQERQAVTA